VKLTRRTLLQAPFALPAAQTQSPSSRPNLLFLMADDHAGYVMGCSGNTQARTPNIDQLAREGVRFARNYCNSPVCTPSRQSILTGQMPHSAGVALLATPLSEQKPTVARQLAACGYRTAVFGKMHFKQPGRSGLHGFQTAVTEDVVAKRWAAEVRPGPVAPGAAVKPRWQPFKDPARIWLNSDKLPFPRRYQDMKSTWVARQACDFLEQHAGNPFALWVSLAEPHSPFDFPMEDSDAFSPGDFHVPVMGPGDPAQIPLIFRDLSPPDKQGIIASYYTSVRYMDRNLGVVLRKLKELGLEKNTLVVYRADHGYSLGHHGRFEKHCCFEPALGVPLIMRWTGRVQPRVVQGFTESVDVPHTILDMLGSEPLPVRHGRSLRPYLEAGRHPHPRTHIFSEYLENEEACVRTGRWKLIQCSGRRARKDGYVTGTPAPGRYVRLYDQKHDPGELDDRSQQYTEIVTEPSRLMVERFRSTHPDAAQEPPSLSTPEIIDWYLRPRDSS
jgi:arylsulfatase A-like enzyme